MPGQGIVVSIQAKIEGWQEQIKQIQNAMKNVKFGTEFSKSIGKDLQQVESMVNNLGKHMNQRLTSDSQVTNFVDRMMEVESMFNRLGTTMSNVSFGDLNPDFITSSFKELLSTIEQANTALSTGMQNSFQSAVSGSVELQKVFKEMKLDPKDMNIDEVKNALSVRGDFLEKTLKEQNSQVDELRQKLRDVKTTQDEISNSKIMQVTDPHAKAQEIINSLPATNNNLLNEDNIREKVAHIRSELLGLQFSEGELKKILPKAEDLLRDSNWDKLSDLLAKSIRDSYTNANTKLEITKQSRVAFESELRAAQSAAMKTSASVYNNRKATDTLQNDIIKQVMEENKPLQEKVNSLEQQLQAESTANIRNTGTSVYNNAIAGYQAAAAAAKDYSAELSQVQSKEQMMSKVQGVVQRYFSIYAAVRMASKAIRNMMSNIKDLDKTITDIAIVTKMNQDDLWGQMPQYTKMANDYAASISGVYKVSQLYYQQGLDQSDVMALTEQTLKMARISGLDYADATDYMTNAIRSFKMEMTDASTVVDVYSSVAATSASSVTELATAMSKTASSAAAVGSSFENTTAMLAVMIEATRESPENIGSAMKSIISRYGELKENKTGIDTEGEEYSLNKVDKALQTVGISIHDANGEFRDFDDVIMELAEKWNTIDKNTQRYIATVMAGNRQQSRFLALVSSADRLKEESEKAANSEDASQLQFLKTLDSVEAKTQQLQTSIQSLYTSSGMEKLYKDTLDFGNAIAQSLNNLSGKSGLGMALGKIGADFTSMATLATTAFSVIKTKFTATKSALEYASKLDVAKQNVAGAQARLDTLRLNPVTLKSTTTRNADGTLVFGNNQEEVDEYNRQLENAEKDLADAQGKQDELISTQTALQTRMAKMNKWQGWGMAASAAGTALSAWANNVDINENRALKAGLSTGSSVLSGLGTGLMVGATAGGPVGAVVGVLTALPGVLQGLGMFTETTAERLQRLQKNVDNTKNERIQSKDDLRTLEDYKKKYDELNKTQYDSNEKKEEFIKLQNEIAENYPELIKGMTEEGNYLINMSEGYERLAEAKREAYKEDIVDSIAAETAGLKDADYVLQNVYGTTPLQNQREWHGLFDSSSIESLMDIDYKDLYGDKRKQIFDALGDTETVNQVFSNLQSEDGTKLDFSNITGELHNDLALVYYNFIDELNKNKDYSTAVGEITQKMGESYEWLINAFGSDVYKELLVRKKVGGYQQQLINDKMDSYNTELINLFADSTESAFGTESSDIQKRFIRQQMSEDWNEYYAKLTKEQKTDPEQWKQAVKDFYANYNEFWYQLQYDSELISGLTDKQNEFYQNLGQHTESEIAELFPTIQDTEGLDEVEKANAEIINQRADFINKIFKQDYENIIKNYNKWLGTDESVTSGAQDYGVNDYSEKFGPEFLQQIQSLYSNVLQNDKLTDAQKRLQVEAINNVNDIVAGLEFDQKNAMLKKLSGADLTSLSGIYGLIEQIDNPQIKEKLLDLSNVISVNLVSSFSSFSDELIKNSENLEKNISKASQGMDLSEASKMAGELGIHLSDFSFREGKYFYDIAEASEKIQEGYLKFNQDLKDRLDEEYNAIAGDGKEQQGLLQREFRDRNTENGFLPILDYINTSDQLDKNWKDMEDRAERFNALQNLFGDYLDDKQIDNLINIYDQYYDAWKAQKDNEDGIKSLNEYALKELGISHDEMTTAIEDYSEYQLNSALLSMGQISAFLERTGAKKTASDYYGGGATLKEAEAAAEAYNENLISRIATGNIDNLPKELQQFGKLIYDSFSSIKSSIVSNVFDALEGGETGILVTDTNKTFLKQMQTDHGEWISGNVETNKRVQLQVDKMLNDEDNFKSWVKQNAESRKQELEWLEKYNNIKYPNKAEELKGLVDQTESISGTDFQKYLDSFDKKNKELDQYATDYGLAFNKSTGQWDIKDYDTYIQSLKNDATLLEEGSEARRKAEIQINAASRAQKNKQAADQIKAFEDVIKNYNKISDTQITALQESLGDNWEIIEDYVTPLGTGEYKLDVGGLKSHLSELGLSEKVQEAILGMFDSIADDYLKNITTATSMVTQGTTNQADIQKFITGAKQLGVDAENAFSYDSILNTWTLNAATMGKYVQAQAQQLVDDGLLTAEEVNKYVNKNVTQALMGAVDIKAFLEAENKQGQARQKLAQQLKNAGIYGAGAGKYSEDYTTYLENAARELGMPEYTAEVQKRAREMAESGKKYNDQIRDNAANSFINTIEEGGKAAVDAMAAIATLSGKELTSADIESAYRAQVSKIEAASEKLTSGVGSLVSGEAIQILENAGYQLQRMGDGNTAVIEQAGNIANAYAQFYETLKSSGAATLESLNSAYAKVLETRQGRAQEQQAIEALGDASGMTFETLGAIFSEAGINLEQYADELESSGIIKSLGGNKVRIKDFAAFARRMDWETNSEEYLSAFSAFNDNLVEQNAKNKKSVQDELSKLKEAKPGDLLNLTYTMSEMEKWAKSNKKSNQKEIKDAKKRLLKLNESTRIYEKTLDEIQQLQAEDYMTQLSNSLVKMGAVLSDGILQITDEANLLGISRILADAATNLGGTLGAELSDMVQSIIDSYTDVINKGIEGTLTNLEKTDLIKKGKDLGINLTADDFYESAEGFEMTTTAAIKAYTAMGQADTRAKKKIYKTLSQQLKDNNESYATATSMLSHIAELQEDINNLRKQGNDANEERINQLAEEVALAKEMHMYSLTHEDSTWNFMSNDAIPDSIDNALNYFANWGQAKTSLGEWSQKGVSDLNQFAALLQHVQEVADATTGSVEFMGTTVGKNGQITYDKFLDSIDKITKYNEKSGAWEIDNNSMLSVLGLNMNLGSKGITQNTKNAIDAYTQMNTKELEAFYEFGNGLVAVKKSLGNYSDVSFGHTFDDFITDGAFDYKRFMQQLGNTEGALEAFNAFAENVSIDGNNFAELMASSEADFSDGSKNFAAAKSVITMALSEGWDMESDYQAIADQLSSTGFEGELTVGDTTFTVKEGRVITKFEKEGGVEYYDPYGGGPYETATDAWNAINTRELNDFAQLFDKYKNSEQTQSEIAFTVDGMTYTIKVKDDHYVIEQDNGKGVKETSEAETINGAIANSKKQAEKVNQSIAEQMSDAGWQEYITGGGDNYGQGRNFKSGKNLQGFITSDTRSVLQSSSFTSGTQLKQRALELWNDSGLSRKQASAQFKIETGIDIDPNTATESFDKINWDSYIKEADLTQTAADVASGIAAALDNQDVSSRISNSVTSGFTQAMTNMTQEGMEEVKIPIKLDPANAQATIDSIKSEPIPLQYEGVPPEKAPEAPDGEGKINYTIGEKEELPQQVSQGIINWKNNYTIPSGLTTTGTINWKSNGLPKATGTVGLATGDAHAKSTLMGELGPELVVSNNRYFVVGQNGPEFVDLAEDAIVFNHLQTQSLLEKGMSNSRGKAVTNERKAVAYAHGSIHGGPAHDISTWTNKYRPGASNMWDNGTASALSNAVGAAVEEISEAFIKTLDIWYNYLQEIAKLETQLSYEETLRSKLQSDFNKDGQAYYDSQTRSLQQMAKTIAVDQELITKQTEYQQKRYKEMVDAGNPFTAFYELDEDNQLRYKNGAEDRFNAIFSASKLTNAPYETLQEQYNWLINNGFGAYMEYDKEGKKIEVGGENDKNGSGMKSAIQAFVDKMEADREEMQGITDSINDAKSDVLEKQEQQNEILQEMRDNEIDLAEKVMDAIVDKMQRQIDEMTDQKEALQKANDDLIKGLSDTLSKEREMYDMQQSESDLESKRRRLAILQRSGGSASEINSLQAEIDTATKDLYFDKQQQQIDTIQEASDAQIEKMEKQIEIAQESLDWQKKYGLLWDDVYQIMNSQDPNGIAATITEWNSDYWGKNPTELEKDLDDIRFSAGQWKAYSQDVNDIKNYLVAQNQNKENTGEETSGTWKSDETGWWYEHDDGSYTKNDWEKIDGKWYYFNDQGYMHTGWHHQGNDWYYLRDQGDMHTGWHQEGNQWYYFGSDGKMVTGAQTIDGVDYNFGTDGKLGSSNTGSGTKNKKSSSSTNWEGASSINYDINEKPWKKARGGYVGHGIYELGELGTETVFTAAQTKILRDNILSSRPNSLISLLKSYNDNYGHINDAVNKVEPLENNSIVIERAEVNMNVAQLANDYDAQRAGEQALDRMLNIARKTQASNRIGR